ncbi:thymopoietin a isoform X2 [Cottoperca gobio]|uniref:Thymopoietin a isoform X2 n=1 Tax=Cottoperca gobio TaxID=56716 RepID=A0A6J2S8A3_COTGO|nr:thymopoietin isoform X2 [Cottoperca gobio]
MSEYLDDPSVLTKEKLKNELLAHNVELPSGNPTKDVYVQLYLKNITANNKKHVTATTLDVFSSDDELPPPVVSSRSRSSGRKATRKTDKVRPDEMDVTVLTDDGLKDELLKHGVDAGPIVASTRKLYEKKLQRLLDDGPAQLPLPELVLTEIQVNHNGNSESDLYSDKEDEVTAEQEPVTEPEPPPVVEKPVRSRGKTPVTSRTRSGQHHTIVPEDLRPLLTDQVQLVSNRRVHQRLDSPVRAASISSRPAQLKEKELGLLPEPSKDSSHKPVGLLNTALLEEPEPSSKPLRPAQSPRPAAKPSRTSSALIQLTKVDPVTLCNISPIKRPEYHWSLSDQFGAKHVGVCVARDECAPPDVLLHKGTQQKITSFMSMCSPMKTLSCTSTMSKDVLVRQVEKIAASDQTLRVEENEVLKELFPNDISSPTGITATCRRPIRGAAHRPVKSSELWNDENHIFSPKTTKTSSSSSSYTESCLVNRVTSLPLSTSTSSFSTSSSSSSRLLSAASPAGQTKAAPRSVSLWIKLFLLAVVAAFLFLVYQAMETNTINPFVTSDTEVASGRAGSV